MQIETMQRQLHTRCSLTARRRNVIRCPSLYFAVQNHRNIAHFSFFIDLFIRKSFALHRKSLGSSASLRSESLVLIGTNESAAARTVMVAIPARVHAVRNAHTRPATVDTLGRK